MAHWLSDGQGAAFSLAGSDWIVPTLVQLEIAKWISREGNLDAADQVLALTQRCRVVPLWTNIAIAAAELSLATKLATADAVVYATARSFDTKVLTCDRHFNGLDGVVYYAKRDQSPE